ncbi:DUF7546 family protein [Halorussus caseinilyticus]|uniref:DUF2568 domain-containing protein n=1 Tax=Halorussus caseinilyticus TaxID=3034025 RepID=A0ABD5WKM2_9EURY
MTGTLDFDADRLRPSRDTLLWAGLLVNTELVLTFAYLLLADVTITEWRYLVFPFVWINVAVWAFVRTTPTAGSDRARYLGVAIAVGYFLLLAYVGGLVKPGPWLTVTQAGRSDTTTLPAGRSVGSRRVGDQQSPTSGRSSNSL